MKLQDLFAKYTDKQILKQLVELYPDEKKNLKGYLAALDEIHSTKPRKSTMQLEFSLVHDIDGEEDDYISIGIIDKGEHYSASFVGWSKWLAMDIIPNDMTELDIVCHCLWEMTWYGYSNRDNKNKLYSLNKMVKDYKDGKAEGIPFEDITKL